MGQHNLNLIKTDPRLAFIEDAKNTNMNFKFLIITLVLTSGFIGGVFAQAQELFKAEAPDEEQLNEIEGKAVLIRTQYGSFMIELFPEHAPNHVEAFLARAESDFYVGTVFHRIIPGFMIQGVDHLNKDPEAVPATWGQGRPSENIDNEFNTIKS